MTSNLGFWSDTDCYNKIMYLKTLKEQLKVIILKIFISLSFEAPMAISSNCRCVSDLTSQVSSVVIKIFFVCSAIVTRTETGKTSTPLHIELKSDSIALKALLKA